MTSFEYFLPEVLREVHDEWEYESLDGVYPRWFRNMGDREAELLGLAIFISDQTVTPVYVELQLSPTLDRVAWIDLRLGEHTETGCRREPYRGAKVNGSMLHIAERFDSIDWFYHVSYGDESRSHRMPTQDGQCGYVSWPSLNAQRARDGRAARSNSASALLRVRPRRLLGHWDLADVSRGRALCVQPGLRVVTPLAYSNDSCPVW
jgi:hypothetical protein